MALVLPDQIAHGVVSRQDLERGDPSRPIEGGDQLLGHDPLGAALSCART